MAQRSGVGGRRAAQFTFEERAGFWWLRGQQLDAFQRLTGLRCDGDSVGFDIGVLSACAEQFADGGVRLALVHNGRLTVLRQTAAVKVRTLTSRSIYLAPQALSDARDLSRLCRKLGRTAELSSSVCEPGELFVYRVAGDMYEVDWALTAVPKSVVETTLAHAYRQNRTVRCRLVPANPRCSSSSMHEPAVPAIPVTAAGQLSLL